MRNYYIYGMLLLLLVLVVTGCTEQTTGAGSVVSEEVIFDDDLFSDGTADADEEIVSDDLDEDSAMEDTEDIDSEETVSEDVNSEEDLAEENVEYDIVVEVVEGDLVELKPAAKDPDGDEVTFKFSEPLNANGKWQTNEGDAGKYLITVTAQAGKSKISQDVLVDVKPANKAPTVECPESLKVNEGDDVFIDCNIFDVDGSDSDIVVEFSGWLKSPFYTTTFDDEGEHTVVVSASDVEGKENFAEVKINVRNVNREPEFTTMPEDLIVMEGDLITIDYEVIDPDGDELEVSFSNEFDDTGAWQTEIGDAGTFDFFVAVNDGEFTIQEEFEVVVELVNTAPVMKRIADIRVLENDTIEIIVDATDREGDKLTVEFSGWMNSETKKTTFEDARPNGCGELGCAAEYSVTVTVSDGFLETSQDVTIFVTDKDQPIVWEDWN